MTPAQLAAEITADPAGLGYAPRVTAGDHAGIAALLNAPTATDVEVERVSAADLQECVSATEYLALSAAQRELWAAILAAGTVGEGIRIKRARVRAQIEAVFTTAPTGNNTRARLALLQVKKGSRAEVLWGDGRIVTHDDVRRALA